MAKLSAGAFALFLEARVRAKDGYIMGATGQDPKTLSAWWFNQYSGSQRQKALYWKAHAARVWDCQGLADGYVSQMTGARVNVRARDNYKSWCGQKGKGMIPAEFRVPGAAVFWGASPGAIAHVAFLTRAAGNGDFFLAEARGVSHGVVSTRLMSRKPDFWGLMDKYFDYGGASAPGFVCAGDGVNVREGPGTGYPSVGVLYKGDAVAPLSAWQGWTPVAYGDGVKWVCSEYVKEVV